MNQHLARGVFKDCSTMTDNDSPHAHHRFSIKNVNKSRCDPAMMDIPTFTKACYRTATTSILLAIAVPNLINGYERYQGEKMAREASAYTYNLSTQTEIFSTRDTTVFQRYLYDAKMTLDTRLEEE
jgi:hypothetical protein